MILEPNERGSGQNLADHLMNPRDNDHVTLHLVDGFVSDDLHGAFAEAEAISQATQCSNCLFSLSLIPPPEADAPISAFEDAISDIEKRLGLVGQPKAIVFHEKKGRRYAHCVWSRIEANGLRSINLPHYRRKLTELSRDLYLEHDWFLPAGFRNSEDRDPNTYRRPEGEKAKQHKRDPKELTCSPFAP